MLTAIEFLYKVLPRTGLYCTVRISRSGGSKRTHFHSTIEELYERSLLSDKHRMHAYYAMASFPGESRKAENAQALRSFFIDVDCGPGKGYPDKAQGLIALRQFVRDSGLPTPVVVDSGHGAHAYWPLEEDIPAARWLPMAERLKKLCVEHGFTVDPAPTADRARILRVPDTHNHKNDPAPQVVVLRDAPAHPVELYEELLATSPEDDPFGALDPEALERVRGTVSPIVMQFTQTHDSSFKEILTRSVNGSGCAQMLYAVQNQATLEEPLWRAALSIANVCEDREKAIHAISKGYPGYNKQEALDKAAQTKGPYTCETFRNLNPAVCEGCPHNITSPIQLGRVFKGAEQPVEVAEELASADAQGVSLTGRTFTIPMYPAPFARGRLGGVYMVGKDEDGNQTSEMVYPYDLYVERRIHDPDNGEMMLMRLHLPQDGVREFLIPLPHVLAQDKLRDALGSQGVTAVGKRLGMLMTYITRWVEELQTKEQALKSRRQFGWTDDYKSFVVGDREILGTGERYSPPSVTTLSHLPSFSRHGSLEVWKSVVAHYNTVGLEGKAFAVALGFGNMLMHMTNVKGYWLSLQSKESGSGKTTVLRAIASIYGDPNTLMMREKDTENAFWNRTGMHKNLPITLDEITEMSPERVSSYIYGITEGRAKSRLMASADVERTNNSHWSTGVTSTSNIPMWVKITKNKIMPEGEAMRMLEMYIPRDTTMDAVQADEHFGQLNDNYGHAIEPFVRYVINNPEKVQALVNDVRIKLARAMDVSSDERFWLAMGTLALAGATICKEIGLLNYDIKRLREHFLSVVKNSRQHNESVQTSISDFLGTFLQTRVRETLVVRKAREDVLNFEVIREPLTKLSIRYESDVHMLYIATSEFRAECNRVHYPMEDALVAYKLAGAYKGEVKARLSTGSAYDTGVRSSALVFDTRLLPDFDERLGDEPSA